MELANEIRGKFIIHENLMNYFIEKLKSNGRLSIICDKHIGSTGRTAIPLVYESYLTKWAYDNGFNVGHHYNSYGTRYLDISI